jgi:IS5 family transposase
MAIKQTGQPSFAEAFLPREITGKAHLDQLTKLIDWHALEQVMAHLRDERSAGRPGYPVLLLFKSVVLQSLYGLSERDLQEALDDRLSFKRFVGLSLADKAPDHTVLNRSETS